MSRYRSLALFLLLSALWGTAFPAIKAGLAYFPPVLFAAIRYDIAALVMLAYAAHATDRFHPETRREWFLVGIGGTLMIAAYHSFLFVGEQTTTSAAAAVIVSLSPVLTAGFARGFLPDERLTVVGLTGLVLGLLGVAVLAEPRPENLFGGDTAGEFLVFCAATAFALGSVLARRFETDLPIETMEAWSMLFGAILMHFASLVIGESLGGIEWTIEGIGALAYLSLVASALGFLLYFDLLERLGPIEINLVSYVAPLFAALVGWLYLGEAIDPATAAGFALVAGGFVLLKREAIRQVVVSARRTR